MRRRLLQLLICTGLMLASAPAIAATNAEVEAAIRKHVERLYSVQKDGHWETGTPDSDKQYTGRTALATYALLSAGEKPQGNPRLSAAIDFLKQNPTQGIYALGLRAQVWLLLEGSGDPDIRSQMRHDAVLLAQGALARGEESKFRGQYHYLVSSRSFDHSCGQYGVLGAWAAAKAGFELPDAYWFAVEQAWIKEQDRSGGWKYQSAASDRPVTLNMTAAGIATLFITQDMLRSNDGLRCTGNISNPPIDKAVAWMAEHLPEAMARGRIDLYGMYGLERIGVASGLKYFGDVDWYAAGAERLVRNPRMWNYRGASVGSSFGILFLVHGRAPVAINKLQYSLHDRRGRPVEGHWNQRPRDIANAVGFIGEQMERRLNWQIVNLDHDVADLHDAPVLYLSGNQLLYFSDDDKDKLRRYVQQGGLIVGHADCGHFGFANTFKELGMELFPAAGEFRRLDRDHPIYTRQQFLARQWRMVPDLQGLSNGVRELMLLIPARDPGKAWQMNDYRSQPEPFQMLSNIFLYTSEGRDLRYKGETFLVSADPKTKPTRTIKVARLMAGENPDPEPAGWARLASILHNRDRIELKTTPVPLDVDALAGYRIAHLTGTAAVELDGPEREALRRFVTSGGTLLVDAAGGSSDFAWSAEEQLRQVFGDAAGGLEATLPADHPVYDRFDYPEDRRLFRAYARTRLPTGLRHPQLRAIEVDGRAAVLVSREDLSSGLVGHSIDGIVGYEPDAAVELMRAQLLYAAGGDAGSGAE